MSAIIIGREEQDNELPPPTPVLRAAALSTLQTPASRRQDLHVEEDEVLQLPDRIPVPDPRISLVWFLERIRDVASLSQDEADSILTTLNEEMRSVEDDSLSPDDLKDTISEIFSLTHEGKVPKFHAEFGQVGAFGARASTPWSAVARTCCFVRHSDTLLTPAEAHKRQHKHGQRKDLPLLTWMTQNKKPGQDAENGRLEAFAAPPRPV